MRRTCFFRSFSAEDILLFLLFPIPAFILARFVSDLLRKFSLNLPVFQIVYSYYFLF